VFWLRVVDPASKTSRISALWESKKIKLIYVFDFQVQVRLKCIKILTSHIIPEILISHFSHSFSFALGAKIKNEAQNIQLLCGPDRLDHPQVFSTVQPFDYSSPVWSTTNQPTIIDCHDTSIATAWAFALFKCGVRYLMSNRPTCDINSHKNFNCNNKNKITRTTTTVLYCLR